MDYPITMFGKTYNSEQEVKEETARQNFNASLIALLPKDAFAQYGEELCKAKPERREKVQKLLAIGANPDRIVNLLGLDDSLFEYATSVDLYLFSKRKPTSEEISQTLSQKKV